MNIFQGSDDEMETEKQNYDAPRVFSNAAASSDDVDDCHLYFRSIDAHVIKHLVSTIATYNRTMTLTYNADGISIDEIDSSMRTMIRVRLHSERFGRGAYRSSDEIPVTVNLSRLYKHMRSIKKKDTVDVTLLKSLDLVVRTRQPSAQRHHETTMKVQSAQSQSTDYPSDYDQPVVVASSELQKLCKDIDLRSGQGVTVSAHADGSVDFSSNELNGFAKTRTTLGDLASSDGGRSRAPCVFSRTYDLDQIRGLMRMTPLSNQVRIYMKQGRYICFSTDVGPYGVIDIYHKSNDPAVYENND